MAARVSTPRATLLSLRPRLWPFRRPRSLMLVRPMITDPGAIRIRALIPDPAAIRTGRAMSMPRLDSRSPPATGVPSASGTVLPGVCAKCASAADQVASRTILLRQSPRWRRGARVSAHNRILTATSSSTGRLWAVGWSPSASTLRLCRCSSSTIAWSVEVGARPTAGRVARSLNGCPSATANPCAMSA
jgi:hypothetical protein